MNIKLISKDSALSKLCCEIITEITANQSTSVTVSCADTFDSPGDLYIWDFQAGSSVKINWPFSNLVLLAHQKDLPAVKAALGFEATVVLKPVSRATLSAILSYAVSTQAMSSLRKDRDEILQHLIEANLKLQEYDQNRTTFLTRVVHDFRAPLTALSGYCGLLLGEPLGALNDGQREVVQRMQQSIRRLLRMTAGMLQVSTSRHVPSRPHLQRADIRNCLAEALDEIGPFANEKKIAIDVRPRKL